MGVVVVNSPAVLLYDSAGVAMAVSNGVAIPVGTSGLIVAGSDGTNARFLLTTADGSVRTRPWDGTNSQPSMDAAARAGFQKVTDGTNLLPTMDVAARAGFQKITDGTNTMPTMDAIGRAGFHKLTDGTNTATVKGASAAVAATDPALAISISPNSPLPAGTNTLGKADQGAPNTAANYWPVRHTDGTNFLPTADAVGRALFSKITDGSNTMPTMDAIGRAGFQKLTDGTNTAAVTAASALKVDGSAVTQPVNGTVTANQGTANTAANRWPIFPTDGTNNMPMLDAAARAGFFKLTDGTNIQPTGDVAARKIFVQPTDGTNNQGYDANNHAFVAGKSATGVAPTGNPVAVSGVDDGGLKRAWLTWTDGSARIVPAAHKSTLFNNGTITATGSTVLSGLGMSEWYLVINIKNAPTGTTPSITFKIEAVDPIDQSTVIDATTTQTGVAHTAAGTEAIQFADNITDTVKITWTVTGTTPSFTGVNVTWVGHVAGNAIEGQAEAGQALREGPVPVAGVDINNIVQVLKVAADGSLIVAPTGSDKTNGSKAGYVVLGGGTSGSFQSVRATAYNEQTTNAQRSVSSSNTNDTSAGTGARTVTITYYDSTGAGPFTETVTMNGTTAVNTVSTTICFIESIVVATVGTGGSNAGTITLFTTTGGGGTAIGTIAVGTLVTGVGDNRTLWAHHYVATGKTCNVTDIVVGASASTTFVLRTKNPTSTTSPEIVVPAGVFTASGEFSRSFGSPLAVAGPARIVLYGIPSTNGVTINGAFDFYE